jgi:IgGFc binding protein
MLGLRHRSSELCGIAVAIGLVGWASCGVDKVKFNSLPELVVSTTTLAVLEGERATFTVALTARPPAPMLVTLRSTAEAKVAGAPLELTFSPEDFDEPQTVTVTGMTDRDAVNEMGEIIVESEGDAVSVAVSVIECPTLAAQDFWLIFNPNNGPSGRRDVHVAGAPGTSVTIADQAAMEIPASGILTFDIGLTRIPNPGVVESGKAFQVSATAPVQVFANNFLVNTVDAFTAVPVQLLGTDYRAIGYSTSAKSQITVVATEDNTTVTISAPTPITVTLNRGQSYLRNGVTTEDITGFRVVSDKPVGVNTGDACINTGAGACDHVEEMLFPVSSWASDYFIPTLPQAQAFRVVAAEDGTEVLVDGVSVATLAAGAFYNSISSGKRVQTSKPSQAYIIALGETPTTGDPAFVLLPGVQNGVDSTTFSALSADNTNTLIVSMPTAATASLKLDGVPVQATWTPYASGDYSHAQIGIEVGSHSLAADAAFIPIVWGEKIFESYAYVAGYGYPKQRCTLPMP